MTNEIKFLNEENEIPSQNLMTEQKYFDEKLKNVAHRVVWRTFIRQLNHLYETRNRIMLSGAKNYFRCFIGRRYLKSVLFLHIRIQRW